MLFIYKKIKEFQITCILYCRLRAATQKILIQESNSANVVSFQTLDKQGSQYYNRNVQIFSRCLIWELFTQGHLLKHKWSRPTSFVCKRLLDKGNSKSLSMHLPFPFLGLLKRSGNCLFHMFFFWPKGWKWWRHIRLFSY